MSMTSADYANWIEAEAAKADAELRSSQDYAFAYGRVHSLCAAAVAVIRDTDPSSALQAVTDHYDALLSNANDNDLPWESLSK